MYGNARCERLVQIGVCRNTGCTTRNAWHKVCSSGCSSAYGSKRTATYTWSSCYQGCFGSCGSGSCTFAIYRSYMCKDDHNNLIPTPTNDGFSATIATTVGAKTSVTLRLKFKAVVGKNDECRIQYCQPILGDGPENKDTTWQRFPFTCQQTVGAGSTQSFSKTVSVKSNRPGVPFYQYWADVSSKSLSHSAQNLLPFTPLYRRRLVISPLHMDIWQRNMH